MGIGVYADASQVNPVDALPSAVAPSPIKLLATQAAAMLVEAGDGQGMVGADLDTLVGADPGMPAPSYLVAGWITGAHSPRSEYALKLMGVHKWTNAPAIVFPTLVLTLYVSDAARFADSMAGPDGSAPSVPAPSVPAPSVPAPHSLMDSMRPSVTGLCSQVQGFIDGTISAVFDSIGHLANPSPPTASNGDSGSFLNGLKVALSYVEAGATSAVNGAIDAAHFLVVNLVGLLTRPVLGYIAKIAGVVAVVAMVVSLLRPWTIRIDPAPPQTRKAVGDESGLPGSVTATVDLGGFDTWPTEVESCANAANVTLPPLKPVGAKIAWTMTQPEPLVVESPGTSQVLDDNATAQLAYTTTQEFVETAKGNPVSGAVTIKASIRRNAVTDAQKAISDVLFDQIPNLIKPILVAILRPSIEKVLNDAASLLDSDGNAQVAVSYHEPDPTTTTSSPSTEAPVAARLSPCAVTTEQDVTSALGYDPGVGLETLEPWGGQCNYDEGVVIVNVVADGGGVPGGKAGYDSYYATAQQGKANDTTGKVILESLAGIGDAGFVSGAGPYAGAVFYVGKTLFLCTIFLPDIAAATPVVQATALARAAAGRLAGG